MSTGVLDKRHSCGFQRGGKTRTPLTGLVANRLLVPPAKEFLPESHLHGTRAGPEKPQHLLTVETFKRNAAHGEQLRPHL